MKVGPKLMQRISVDNLLKSEERTRDEIGQSRSCIGRLKSHRVPLEKIENCGCRRRRFFHFLEAVE